MKLIRMLISLKSRMKVFLKTRMFRKASVLGEGTKIDSMASCSNETGDKNNIVIGRNSMIRCNLTVQGKGKIEIGDRVYIGGNTMIGAAEKIVIGDDVIIAGGSRIYDNNNHPTSPADRLEMSRCGDFFGAHWKWNDKVARKPVHIQNNVWIGEHCSVLKGVTIGEGSIVGCRSVVTKDVPPYTVVAGNPAQVVKKLDY